MPTPEVIERVRKLQQELARTPPDPALAPLEQQLATIMLEPHDAAHYTSLSDRLRGTYEKLEADHPTIAAAMQAAINALQAAGI